MQQNSRFYPLITYIPSTQSLQLHHNVLSTLQTSKTENSQKHSFVSVIQVKPSSYKSFLPSPLAQQWQTSLKQHNKNGIYISEPTYSQSQNRHICYLILPPISSQYKMPQKYQDLFASILLILSKVCIYDISSKYLRQSKYYEWSAERQSQVNRNNYVVMNAGGCCGQLYKANIHSGTNKMEISAKIGNSPKMSVEGRESEMILNEIAKNITVQYQLAKVMEILQKTVKSKIMLKNYLNFEEIQYKVLLTFRIIESLQQNSEQYMLLTKNKQFLSLQQLKNISALASTYKYSQNMSISASQYSDIFSVVKQEINSELQIKNKKLIHSFLLQLKSKYFKEVSSLGELFIKRELSQKMLKQYGIPKQYCSVLYSEAQFRIQANQIKNLNSVISQKQKQIKQLHSKLTNYQTVLVKNAEYIQIYEQKDHNFCKLNKQYIQKCEQLEKQIQLNFRSRMDIENLLRQIKLHLQEQQKLKLIIKQHKQFKEQQQKTIISLHEDIKLKQNFIGELKQKNRDYQFKIQNYKSLENQAWKSIQQIGIISEQCNKYRTLLQKLEEHFDNFKRLQIQKFNYVLRKNNEQYTLIKRQSEQKNKIIQQLSQKINKVYQQLQEQKSRVRFCQEQVMIMGQNSISVSASCMNPSINNGQNGQNGQNVGRKSLNKKSGPKLEYRVDSKIQQQYNRQSVQQEQSCQIKRSNNNMIIV